MAASYENLQSGGQQPSTDQLKVILRYLIDLNAEEDTYLVVDALDECSERENLLEWLEELLRLNLDKLHIMVTSRKERDIETCLSPLISSSMNLESSSIDTDIATHVYGAIRRDRNLRTWPLTIQYEIAWKLITQARGM